MIRTAPINVQASNTSDLKNIRFKKILAIHEIYLNTGNKYL